MNVKHHLVDDPDPHRLEPGWNQFRKAGFSRYLDDAVGPGRQSFAPFQLPFDLAPRADDPVRTWTFQDHQRPSLIRSGLNLLIHLGLLEKPR